MFLRLAAACLIFLWMTGSTAEAEECQGNSRALGTSFPVANAEEWAATPEAPAATSACWAGWASPWLVEAVPSSLPLANILLMAILLAGQPLTAVADEKGTTISVEQVLPAAEGGNLASEMLELDESILKSLKISQQLALLVVLPAKDGPADKAGLKPGDIILTLNGQPTPNLLEFADVSRTGIGGEVRLGVWRRGERMTLPVRLESTSGRSASIEQVIEAYKVIGKTLEKSQFPAIWGCVQVALGESYWIRAEGRFEDNVETAIAAYKSALTVLTREEFPKQWARTENHLALAYTDRVRGSRAENLDAAIEAHEATLTILTKEAFPEDRARVQEHLVQAYRARFRDESVDNRRAATEADGAALTVPPQANSSAPPPAATNQAPLEASAQPEGRQSEQAAKATAQPTVAQNESRSPVKRDNSSSQPAEALRQTPREADLKREAPQAGGESKQISQHSEASEPRRKAVQTKPRQSGGRLAARSSSAQDNDSSKRNDRSAFAGSAAAQHCTQHNEYNRAGAIAHARVHVQPYGAACSFHRRNTIYSWGCAGGLCAVSVDQQPFTVTVLTEALRFRRWRFDRARWRRSRPQISIFSAISIASSTSMPR